MTPLRVGTRGSALALAQARWVAERVKGAEIVEIVTSGDRAQAAGDKSRWVDAIEAALVAGEIDLAVHSAKDVPSELAEGCALVATPPREDPGDVLILAPAEGTAAGAEGARRSAAVAAGGGSAVAAEGARRSSTVAAGGGSAVAAGGRGGLAGLSQGARVGTTSLRRRAQLLAARPDLDVVELRGNVDTRLRKLDAGEVDAVVLAAAGLARLGLGRAAEALDFTPAPGQGTLAIEARARDERVGEALAAVHDPATFAALEAERAAVRELDASCHTPVGIHARDGTIRGFVGLPDGSAWVVDELRGADGAELARRMLVAGARELLAQAEAMA